MKPTAEELAAKLLEIQVHLENSNKALDDGVAYIKRLERVAVAARMARDGAQIRLPDIQVMLADSDMKALDQALKSLDDGS